MLVMLHRGPSTLQIKVILWCVVLAASCIPSTAESKSKQKHKGEDGPPPSVRIEVEPLGYTAPSRFYLVARFATASLDFADKGHLLFTFREGGLMPRVPGDPKDDTDQVIRAMILDISTGKVVQETRWRMHDRQRYLWSIGHGQFLVRQRHSLYLTDSNLELKPYMQFDTPLQSLSVSPDHKLMMVEIEKYDRPDDDKKQEPIPAVGIKKTSTQILMVNLQAHALVAQSEARHAVDLPLLHDSFLEVFEGDRPDRWVIRNKPFTGKPSIVTEIKSACDPTVTTLSDDVALAEACLAGSSDHVVTAYSLKGNVLWQDRWLPRYIWPTFEFAENGSRFAYGSLQINHSVGSLDPFGEDDVMAQMVGVFDTDTGKLNLVKTASPVLSSGHNYALSDDGTRFAILREGAIEVYDLPPVTSAPAPAIAKASPK